MTFNFIKSVFSKLLILCGIIYLSSCGDKKNNLGPCLLTVEILVTDVNDTLKQLEAVLSGEAGDESITWDGGQTGETLIVSAYGGIGMGGPGIHSVDVYSKSTLCSATSSVNVTFPAAPPTAMIIDSVKIVAYPLDNVGTPWDADGSFADCRFAMNVAGFGGMAETDELYTTQIFFDQGTYPFTFFSDFPYTVTDLDTSYIVSLWNDNAPDLATPITPGLWVANFTSWGAIDSLEMQFSESFPHFMMYVRWEY